MKRKVTKASWELPENAAMQESTYWDRRRVLKSLGLGGLVLSAGGGLWAATGGFPSNRNQTFSGDGLEITPEKFVTSYNNFYEFGTGKEDPKRNANKGWNPEPWTIEIGGLVEKPLKIEVNDLVKKVGGIEQRVYRMRCVEAWSMVIPWDGFQLSKLLALVEPKSTAKFVRFETFDDSTIAPEQKSKRFIDWPYVEGLRIDEAMNPLTLMATGIFGKALPNQNGAPIRLVVPWKYGFKGIKSIVKIELVEKAPVNTWNALQSREYGFYANVNPKVDHPRWSQASERVIGGGFFDGRKDTLMFNGYGEQVAKLYAGMDLKENF